MERHGKEDESESTRDADKGRDGEETETQKQTTWKSGREEDVEIMEIEMKKGRRLRRGITEMQKRKCRGEGDANIHEREG
jgi:hypothetical protein